MKTPTPRKLNPEELSRLSELQRAVVDRVHAIGQLEVRKQRILDEISGMEATAQGVMAAAAARLGVPEGTAWQMMPDGTVVELAPEAQPLATPGGAAPLVSL